MNPDAMLAVMKAPMRSVPSFSIAGISIEPSAEVSATATLTRIEGRRLVFETDAMSHDVIVGTGRIIRVQIDKERFLSTIS